MPAGEMDRGREEVLATSKVHNELPYGMLLGSDRRVKGPLNKLLDIRHFSMKRVGVDGGSLHATTNSVTIPPHRVLALEVTDYAIRPLDSDQVGLVPIELGATIIFDEQFGRVAIQNPGERFVLPSGPHNPYRMAGFIYTGSSQPTETAGASTRTWTGKDGEWLIERKLYVTGRTHQPPPSRLSELGLVIDSRDWTSQLAPEPFKEEIEVGVSGPSHLVEMYVNENYRVKAETVINLDMVPQA